MGSGEGSGEGKGKGKGGCGAEGCVCSEGCVHCARVMLIIFNVIFMIVGLALLGVGIWLVVDPNVSSILNIAGGVSSGSAIIRVIAYVMLGTGGLIFLVSLFGLIGASRWNQCLLATFIAFICILIAAQIAVVILGFVGSGTIGNALNQGMKTFIINDFDEGNSALSVAFRRVQAGRECCGVDGSSDWVNLNTAWYRNNGSLSNWRWPKSCCVLTDKRNPDSAPRNENQCRLGNTDELNTRGCYTQMESFLRNYSFIVGGSLLGVFVLQVLVLMFAGIVHRGLIVHEYDMNNVKPMVV